MKKIGVKMCCVIIAIIALACPNVDSAQDYNDSYSQDYGCVNGDSASVAIGGYMGQMLHKDLTTSNLDYLIGDGSTINKEQFIKGVEDGIKGDVQSYEMGFLAGSQFKRMFEWLKQKGLNIDEKKLLESFRMNLEEPSEEKANEYIGYIRTQMPDLFSWDTVVEAVDSVYVDSVYYEIDSVAIDDYMDSVAVEDSVAVVE